MVGRFKISTPFGKKYFAGKTNGYLCLQTIKRVIIVLPPHITVFLKGLDPVSDTNISSILIVTEKTPVAG